MFLSNENRKLSVLFTVRSQVRVDKNIYRNIILPKMTFGNNKCDFNILFFYLLIFFFFTQV